ncbi:MAG TPA: 50S ribosomal protein L18 [Candidatus Babeliales bacterium]|nr:50S ribosomal protein L18 [Candidatus Babeliales bacterium]
MAIYKKDRITAARRVLRVRAKVKRYGMPPRVSIFRSLKHVYAQIIDDMNHRTIASCSSLDVEGLHGNKTLIAHAIGLELAKRAKANGVEAVVFDRGRFKFHGRVKALADGLREGALKF